MRHSWIALESATGSKSLDRAVTAWSMAIALLATPAFAQVGPFNLRVPAGFEIAPFANPELAPSPQAICLDAVGNVVVTGPGYLRTLVDVDGDGFADRAIPFASPTPGGQGLGMDGPELLMSVPDGVVSYFDDDYDGTAESGPNRMLNHAPGEYGFHGIRKGPDGDWYFAGGMGSGFHDPNPNWGLPSTDHPQAGVLLRWPPGGQAPQVMAHGFRNPYDLDFNWLGDVFTADADLESSFYLPAYVPPRFFHAEPGGHHGWQTSDPERDSARPAYFVHGTSPNINLGRVAPTGIIAYHHYQFPEYYRKGLFVADWREGKIHFVSMAPAGATYQSRWEPFLESAGRLAFTPTDLAVLPDGSLLVAAGGRRVPGGLYRIRYGLDAASAFIATNWVLWSVTELRSVLRAPQPLDAWSRAYWADVAQRLGAEPFAQTALDEADSANHRVRALEVLTEIHGGLAPGLAESAALSGVAEVRARVAWSLGRSPCAGCLPILLGLTRDTVPYVRVQALQALHDHATDLDMTSMQQAVGINLAHPDRRVRAAAIRLAAHLTEPAWNALWALLKKSTAQARLTGAAISLQRPANLPVNEPAVAEATAVLKTSRVLDLQLEAIQLIQIGLGLSPLAGGAETISLPEGYHASVPLAEFEKTTALAGVTADALFPSRSEPLNREVARLLAMLEYESATLPGRLLDRIQPSSNVASDIHYLAVLASLPPATLSDVRTNLAKAFLATAGKLPSNVSRERLRFISWQHGILETFLERIPDFVQTLLQQPDFASPGNERWIAALELEDQERAARRFLAEVQRSTGFPWTPPLVEVLSVLPPAQVVPQLRERWGLTELRDAMIPILSQAPVEPDREKFLWGLESENPKAIAASLNALLELPADNREDTLIGAMRLLRRLLREPEAQLWRAQIVKLLQHERNFPFPSLPERGAGVTSLDRTYGPVFDWLSQARPRAFVQLDAPDGANPTVWESKYEAMRSKTGNGARGEVIYRQRRCHGCHTGTSQLGPDLGGINLRLPRREIFDAVVFPNRHIAPGYRATVVELNDRTTVSGVVAHESFDALFLQPDASTTLRFSQSDIRSRHVGHRSFMPAGLLDGLNAQDLADLFTYLGTIAPAP